MNETETKPPAKTKNASPPKSIFRKLAPLAVLVAIVILVFAMGWHNTLVQSLALNRIALQEYVNANFIVALAGYALLYAVVVALSLPAASFLTIFSGFLFGPYFGVPAVIIGATVGATILFFVVKTSLGDILAERAGPWVEKLRGGFQENALSYLLFLRLVPLFPFFIVNVVPGLLGVSTLTYILGTFFGIMPGTIAFSYVGVGLGSVLDAQSASYQTCLEKFPTHASSMCEFTVDAGKLITPEILIAFAALGVVALIPIVLQKFRKKDKTA